jgi:hypothetical protein
LNRARAARAVAARLWPLALLAGALAELPAPAAAQPSMGTTDTTHVQTKPITLREIIERCIQGERTKLAGHRDLTCTMTERVIVAWDDRKDIHEMVQCVYMDSTGFSRIVDLGERKRQYVLRDSTWVEAPDETKVVIEIEVGEGYSDFANLPFFLEDVHDYDFELVGRTIEVDHVIFEIAFEPKSPFKALPSGTVFVDTNAYRIIHEEFRFDTNPFPLFLKDVKRISRHWEQLPTGEWVYTKMYGEFELRTGMLKFMPKSVTMAMVRDDFVFDAGYDAKRFGER